MSEGQIGGRWEDYLSVEIGSAVLGVSGRTKAFSLLAFVSFVFLVYMCLFRGLSYFF